MPLTFSREWLQKLILATVLILLLAFSVSAGDWPAYRRDARRSAVSTDQVDFPLTLTWHRTSKLPPQPAFADPVKHPTNIDFAYVRDGAEPVLLDFDHAHHPVAANGRVYFGSSADDSVRCLSLATGKQQWVFVTGGPVRFAPQVVGDRVYVASDDGFVFCLTATNGNVVWKFRAAPSHRQLAGNGRMISRWPLRSGVLVLDGIIYVTAGMWPAEGVFVYALDAATGQVQWVNDTSGTLNQSSNAYAISGVAPTGYLLAGKEALVVPTGRSVPAAYSRNDGRLLASTAPSYQNRRGGPAVCIDPHGSVIFGYTRERLTRKDYSIHYAYRLPNLTQYGTMRADRVIADDRIFVTVNDLIRCYDANSLYTKVKVEWEHPCPSRQVRCLSLSANALLLGVDNRVVARDRKTGDILWEHDDLDGYVHSIAVADGRLLASTDRGSVYCFSAGSRPGLRPKITPQSRQSLSLQASHPELRKSLQAAGVRRGLALIIGERDTKLASEIAAATQLQVVLLLGDSEAVMQTRRELLDTHSADAGQVSVQHHPAGQPLPFADFAFNLIVAPGGRAVAEVAELYRVLRPVGGMIYVKDAASEVSSQLANAIKTSNWKLNKQIIGKALILRRGKLPGALDWDSETTKDQRVKWPLELLWFGGPGSKRTGGGSRPPIAAGGRNYVIGKNHLIALDAYNGTELWSRTMPYFYRNIGRLVNAPGPIRPWLTDSVNADDDHVWLNFGHVVYTLDAATGKQLAIHGKFPEAPTLPLTKTGLQFVLDHYQKPGPRGLTSTKTKTSTPAGNVDLRVVGNGNLTITLELQDDVVIDDRVYWDLFLDVRPTAQRANLYEPGIFHLLARPATGQVERGMGAIHPKVSVSVKGKGRQIVVSMPMAELEKFRGGKLDDFCFAVALNHPAHADQKAMAGNRGYLRWEWYADHFATAYNNGWPRIVVGNPSDNSPPESLRNPLPAISELPERALQKGRIGGVGQRAGYIVTLKEKRETPLSLEVCDFEFNRGKGCGRLVSSASLQVLRSGTLAFYDINDDSGMRYFGGVRPACTISAIPAQGLVFAVEGSSGCSCNYNFKTTLALAPAKQQRNEDWAVFTAPLSPGAQLQTGRFNLGAPGDRRDDQGDLWLQFPRAPTYSSRILAHVARTMPVPVELLGTGRSSYRVNTDRVAIANTDRPWLYGSGYEGIEGVRLKLFMSDKEGIVVFPGDAPKLDAVLEPEAWEKRYAVPAGTGGSLFLSHDSDALYVGYEVIPPIDRRGKRQLWTTREGHKLPYSSTFGFKDQADDATVWEEDSLELLVTDLSLKTILHLGVGVTGGRYDGIWSAARKTEDSNATPAWSGAFEVTPEKAIAEFAIPWQTLKDAGLDIDNLFIRPRTKRPLTRQPHISHSFRPILVQTTQPTTKRYRVLLHFAELSGAAAGERIFDIQIQGKTVEKNFDPVAAAGRPSQAVVLTFEGILADRVLDVRFVRHDESATAVKPPILSALEVLLDK
jgi:outer membrane protein assembly factor BamB